MMLGYGQMAPHHPQQVVGLPQVPPPPQQQPYGTNQPPQNTGSGGYTLPPTASYFPMAAYSSIKQHQNQPTYSSSGMEVKPNGSMISVSQSSMVGCPQPQSTSLVGEGPSSLAATQPNTPDLLMHRRQVSHRNRSLLLRSKGAHVQNIELYLKFVSCYQAIIIHISNNCYYLLVLLLVPFHVQRHKNFFFCRKIVLCHRIKARNFDWNLHLPTY